MLNFYLTNYSFILQFVRRYYFHLYWISHILTRKVRATRNQIIFSPSNVRNYITSHPSHACQFFYASLILCYSTASQATRQNPILDLKLTDSRGSIGKTERESYI